MYSVVDLFKNGLVKNVSWGQFNNPILEVDKTELSITIIKDLEYQGKVNRIWCTGDSVFVELNRSQLTEAELGIICTVHQNQK